MILVFRVNLGKCPEKDVQKKPQVCRLEEEKGVGKKEYKWKVFVRRPRRKSYTIMRIRRPQPKTQSAGGPGGGPGRGRHNTREKRLGTAIREDWPALLLGPEGR